jgi:hypothetical protein
MGAEILMKRLADIEPDSRTVEASAPRTACTVRIEIAGVDLGFVRDRATQSVAAMIGARNTTSHPFHREGGGVNSTG